MRIRLRLMELNRAVCLECPEVQVPWFHERYCQQLQKRGSTSPVQQQVHRMLGEVLGGINCAKVAVVAPYFYTVGELHTFQLELHFYVTPLSVFTSQVTKGCQAEPF